MNEDVTSRMRLVPYRPDDFSAGKVLGLPQGHEVTSAEDIGAALSLYFQWDEYRRCSVRKSNTPDDDNQGTYCVLRYDTDEALPTELRVELITPGFATQLSVGTKLFCQFEVFHVCYAFESAVLAVSPDRSADGWDLIVAMPARMTVQKARTMPRHRVSPVELSRVANVHWKGEGSETAITVVPLELSVEAVRVCASAPLTSDIGTLTLGGESFRGRLTSQGSDTALIDLNFESPVEYGRYFDLYRKLAFPCLRPRREVDPTNLLALYERTGFLKKFTGNMAPEVRAAFIDRVVATWSSVASGMHEGTADYCAFSEAADAITGTCSTTLGFFNGEREVWVFQQLASIAEPQFFEQTKALYLWRPLYLWGRKEDFDLCCWFDADSRWIERLWVKFDRYRDRSPSCLHPIRVHIVGPDTLQNQPAGSQYEVGAYNVGKNKRVFLKKEGVLGAVDPPHLNFSKLLNHTVSVPPVAEGALERAAFIARQSEEHDTEMRITVPHGTDDVAIASLPALKLSRFCYFSKSELPYFYSSLLHSLAVMERKHSAPGAL